MRLAISTNGLDWQDVPGGTVLDGRVDNWLDAVPGTTVPDDIRKIEGTYYLTYHAATNERGSGLALSTDLMHWTGAGELLCDDREHLIIGTAMFVPVHSNDVTDEPNAAILVGQKSLDPDEFAPGLLYKQFCKDEQRLDGWEFGTAGAGSKAEFRNGWACLDPRQGTAAAAWLISQQASLDSDFVIECRRWVRSPRYASLAVGLDEMTTADRDGTSWWSIQPGRGYRASFARGTGFTDAQCYLVKSDERAAASILADGGEVPQNRFWQTSRLAYTHQRTLTYSLGGLERARSIDASFATGPKRFAAIQGEWNGSQQHNGGTQYIDWIVVRPYYGSDPTQAIGQEIRQPQ